MAKRKGKIATTYTCDNVDVKLDDKVYSRNLENALYYVHYQMSNKDLAKEVSAYAKKLPAYKKTPFSALSDFDYKILGKYCFIMNRGGVLLKPIQDKINTLLESVAAKATALNKAKKDEAKQKEAAKKGIVISIQDRLRMKAENVCGEEFENRIDELTLDHKTFDLKTFDPVGVMAKHELKQGHLRYIVKFYQPLIAELEEYLKNPDDDLKEGYKELGKSGVKKLIKVYVAIIDAAGMIITKAKANKKPRQKKVVPDAKVVEKLKFMKDDTILKLASVNPTEILGAKELWVYNTKYRKMGKYVAFDSTGLYVKGASITNIAESSTQKTLRKPAEMVREFKGAKAKFDKAFKSINAIETKLNGRLNEHCILLRVFK